MEKMNKSEIKSKQITYLQVAIRSNWMMGYVRILVKIPKMECICAKVVALPASTLAICVLMWNPSTTLLVICAVVAAKCSNSEIPARLMRKIAFN